MPAAVHRIGQQFGKLLVVGKSDRKPRSFWMCQCECGGNVVVANNNLVSGNTTSCGCDWIKAVKGEMVGRTFGKLTVQYPLPSHQYGKAVFARYMCLCDCGKTFDVLGMSLRNGDTKSCGCAYKDAGVLKQVPAEQKRANGAFHVAKRRAARIMAFRPFDDEYFQLVSREAIRLAKLREIATGRKFQVDHIVPLQSKIVCGLHNEFNLRVIPASVNGSKGNRFWPFMP